MKYRKLLTLTVMTTWILWTGLVVGQETLTALAESQALAYQNFTEQDLGDYHVHVEVTIDPSPDAPRIFQAKQVFDELRHVEKDIFWNRIVMSARSDDGTSNRTSDERNCKFHFIERGNLFVTEILDGQWIRSSREKSTNNLCKFHPVLDWPFITRLKLTESDSPDRRRTDFENYKCIEAKQTKNGLEAKWVHRSGKGWGILTTTFREEVPVHYRMIGFLGPMDDPKTDTSKGRVFADIYTEWKEFDVHRLPVKVAGVVDGTRTVFVDARFEWRLGKDISEELIKQLDATLEAVAAMKE